MIAHTPDGIFGSVISFLVGRDKTFIFMLYAIKSFSTFCCHSSCRTTELVALVAEPLLFHNHRHVTKSIQARFTGSKLYPVDSSPVLRVKNKSRWC